MNELWSEDSLTPRVDVVVRGASPHQVEMRPAHPEWFREGDVVRVGEDRLEGTGKFFYGREIMRATNEAVLVRSVRSDGVCVIQRAFGASPAQRIRHGDKLLIIAGYQCAKTSAMHLSCG